MKRARRAAIRTAAARAGASHRGADSNAMLRATPAPLTRATPARATPTRRRAARRAASARASATAKKPWEERDCRLVLEDGSVWNGRSFGAKATQVGEVVFNTSLSGYVARTTRDGDGAGRERGWSGRERAREGRIADGF